MTGNSVRAVCKHKNVRAAIFYRIDNACLTIHSSIITLKENIQERELAIYKYNCNSSKSITSVSFYNKKNYDMCYML